ncbi:MAG: DNA mismatch repair protein MutS [Natronomonas sp.]
MEEALGPPAAMQRKREELTPMLSQYLELCERYDDALVLFQVGDFYETFCEAAEATARRLEITLTQREDSTGTYPMAGIPIDSAESYIETLLEAGVRVAVADQVEDAEETTGLVDRAVTRVVTPGTLTESELLSAEDNNFVACLTDGYGLALLDVSTGDFYATTLQHRSTVEDELQRFGPSEAIVGPDAPRDVFSASCMVTPYDRSAFDLDAARESMDAYFGSVPLADEAEVRACGALLAYAEYARGTAADGETERLDYITNLTRYDPREYMLLDSVAVRSLEVFEPRHVHGLDGAALVETIDETASALGSRTLRAWLRRPLVDAPAIEARLEAVEALLGRVTVRERLSELLEDVYDLERLIARVSRGRADARDLRALESTLSVVDEAADALEPIAEAGRLSNIAASLDDCPDTRALIDRAIDPSPPAEITEGGVIRDGYDETLDEFRSTERAGKAWIDDLEKQERERTGIDSLKVGHNSVHGYYIEVTNANLDAVPEEYRRRQTLKNSERFYTPELKQREEEILTAEGRADDREYELFCEVRSTVADATEAIQSTAEAVAELDTLVSLATVAAQYDYCRPTIDAECIDIDAGRHPVVERTEDGFVPNPTDLSGEQPIAVVTGPNMSGKSTYMRQVALITLLAQIGSFVPAREASLPIVDRVFTRVGASDDIAGGRSTFFVEMTELATILEAADEDALVVLDEVGRGTSTTDGYAIAQAATEYLHDEVGAYTLFATHHHELTAVAAELPRAQNYHFAAERTERGVEFDHEIRSGAATASYGIEVAETAGVPEAVVDRAAGILESRTEGDQPTDDRTEAAGGNAESGGTAATASADGGALPAELLTELRDVEPAETTPLEALNLLARLQSRID